MTADQQPLDVPAPEPDPYGEGDLEVLVFRVSDGCFALPLYRCREVVEPRAVRRVPHRGGALLGLVNVRGELLPCVSLAALLHDAARPGPDPQPPSSCRMLVISGRGRDWVAPVDRVEGIYRVVSSELIAVPGELTRGLVRWREATADLMDDEALVRRLGSL